MKEFYDSDRLAKMIEMDVEYDVSGKPYTYNAVNYHFEGITVADMYKAMYNKEWVGPSTAITETEIESGMNEFDLIVHETTGAEDETLPTVNKTVVGSAPDFDIIVHEDTGADDVDLANVSG